MKQFLSSADGRKESLDPDEKVTVRASTVDNTATAPAESVAEVAGNLDSLPAVTRQGKPVKLTPRIQKTICDAVRAGNYFSVACRAAGISLDTLARYRKRGEAGEEPFAGFLEALQQAEDDHELAAVKAIHTAGAKDWRAHLEILSRRRPERWSRERERSAFGFGSDEGGAIASGLSIILHLGGPEPEVIHIGGGVDQRRQAELEDHRARERDIENVEALSSPVIKDKL